MKKHWYRFPTATEANRGLLEQSHYVEGGKNVTLITRPRTDLCQQPCYIPDQSDTIKTHTK